MQNVDWNQRYIESNTPWDSGVPSEELKQVIASGLIKPCRVFEIGCGTGTNAIFLAKSGFEVTACDLSDVAIEKAKSKAEDSGASIAFIQADIATLEYDGAPFPFVFDRGTYHIVRKGNLVGFQNTLKRLVEPGGCYLVLAGNANDDAPEGCGPPRMTAAELCTELEFDAFDLVSLEVGHFHGVKIGGELLTPLAWKGVFRRRTSPR